MDEIENFIADLDEERSQVARALRRLVRDNFPALQEIFSWKMPVYTSQDKKVVYIQKGKAGMNFGFNHGSALDEPQDLFQGSGKLMRHIEVSSVDEIQDEYFVHLVEQAIDHAA